MRDLLPRLFRAESRLDRRPERRFLADNLLPFSARETFWRDALLRDEVACLFFAKTVSEKAKVRRTNRMIAKRRDLGE
jgi:hypothetical protein